MSRVRTHEREKGNRMSPEPSQPSVVYANVVEITAGPFDVVMDFGFKAPEQTKKGSSDHEIVARVAMSLAHMKTMLPMMARIVAEYEKKVGKIPAPGFDEIAES